MFWEPVIVELGPGDVDLGTAVPRIDRPRLVVCGGENGLALVAAARATLTGDGK